MSRVLSFTKYRGLAFILSIVTIVAMYVVTFTVHGGFNLGIDFQPGVVLQIKVDPAVAKVKIEDVRSSLSSEEGLQLQSAGDEASQVFIIRLRSYDSSETDFAGKIEGQVIGLLNKSFGPNAAITLSKSSVGPQYSTTLTQMAILLIALAMVFIVIYIWIRFRFGYAVGAFVSTLQNILFMVGFVGVSQLEVSASVIAAILTIIGYALNDTIVVFDRIRENEKTMAGQGIGMIIDTSVTQTLSRTIVTSLTVLLSVIAIFIFTTGVIKDFATAMIVGVVIGTFSSIFIASTVLLEWRALESRRRKNKEKTDGTIIESVSSEEEKPNETFDVDAEAIADQLRRERSDRKKF